jgi:glutathione reductase (NADPH)
MTHKFDYDYFVIGGGSGGVRSARIAASHGAKVGIAEDRHWGGTCVNIGCVPKKLFAYASDYGPSFEDANGFGWDIGSINFDWKRLKENKDKEIERLNKIYQNLLQNNGVTIYKNKASFVDNHTIQVGGKTITADKILIATGAKPRLPKYEGKEHVRISDDMFYLDKLPEHIVIEGAGYIAVEFAHIFHGLGSKVTIIYRGNKILSGFDDDIREFLADEMKKQGVEIIFNTNIEKIEKKDNAYIVSTDNNHAIECDLILSAIGRIPYTEGLGLENINPDMKDNGQIKTNDKSQTSIKNVYAVGDVTDHLNLTPVAIKAGHALADRLFGKEKPEVSYKNIPTAIFSNPPIGAAGYTESDACDDGYDVKVYKTSFRPLRHTLSGRDEKTLMKLVVDKKTDKVLGAHMCGADAPEIMQGIGLALQCGATKADFDRTIGIHPTSAEEFVTMRV